MLLKKHFGVEKIDDLVEKFSKEKKTLQDIEKEFVEGLKKQDFKIKGGAEFLEQEPEYINPEGKKEREKLIKAVKEDDGKSTFKLIKQKDGDLYLVKSVNLNDKEAEQIQEKIKGILETKIKKEFIKSIEKEFASKIETNEDVLNENIIKKQVKKYYVNRPVKPQFSVF